MRHLIVLLLALCLTACVTIVMPPPAPAAAPTPQAAPTSSAMLCPPYQPPPWKQVPKTPEISHSSGNYVKHLERVAERLARHAGELLEYIEDDRSTRTQAVYEHQKSCLRQ